MSRIFCSWVLYISRHEYSVTSLGNLIQCLTTLTEKKCFLVFRKNFLFLNVYALPLVLSVNTTEKILPPSPSFPHQVFVHNEKIALRLSFSRLNSHNSLSLSSYKPSLWAVAGLAPVSPCLSWTGECRTGQHSTPDGATPVLSTEEGSPSSGFWQHSS